MKTFILAAAVLLAGSAHARPGAASRQRRRDRRRRGQRHAWRRRQRLASAACSTRPATSAAPRRRRLDHQQRHRQRLRCRQRVGQQVHRPPQRLGERQRRSRRHGQRRGQLGNIDNRRRQNLGLAGRAAGSASANKNASFGVQAIGTDQLGALAGQVRGTATEQPTRGQRHRRGGRTRSTARLAPPPMARSTPPSLRPTRSTAR